MQADVDAGKVDNSATATLAAVTSAEATATVRLRAGQQRQLPVLAVAAVSGPEDVGELPFTVTLSAASIQTVTVAYATGDDSATAATDYTATSRVLTFAPGARSRTLAVTVSDDDLDEADEKFNVQFSAAWNATLGGGGTELTVSGTIRDDDQRGLSVSPATLTVAEGASKTYAVELTSQPTAQVTVAVGGTTGTDLTVDKTSLTFGTSTWSTAQTVEVSADEDDGAGNDSATLTHTAAGGDYGSLTGNLPVTVTDDDTPALVIDPASLTVTEGGSETYTVKLATEPTAQVEVAVEIAVEGTTDTDLTLDNASLTFGTSTWSTAQTVQVTAGQDDDAEEDRATLTHTAAGGDYGSLTGNLTVTVTDDATDGTAETMLTVAAAAIDEADANLHFTVAATPPSTQMVTVRYATSDGTAAEGSDYTAASGTLTFTVGQPAATVAVPVHEDAVDEADEQFTLTLSEPTGARLAGDQTTVTATGAIIDDDLRGVTVQPTELTLNSGENGVYKVALTSEPTGSVTVTPTVGDDGDLTLVPPRLTFETDDWSTPQAFTVIVHSGRRIVRRAITHDATGADYDDVTPDQVTVTTLGEAPEPPPPTPPRSTSVTLQLEPDRVAEGAGAASVRITATLDASPRPDATAVTVTVSGGSAEVGTDFVSVPSFTVSIPAHAQSGAATFTLAPVDDLLDEVDETVTVGGSTDASDLTVHGATLTISDDDAAPRLSIADARAVENSGEILFQVRLERASGRRITVVCMSEDGTATAPDDYEGKVGVLTLEPGQTAASIRLAVRDDRVHEPDETLKMVLSEPSNVKLEHGAATATGTIIDDDAAVTRMWLSRFGRTVAAEVLDAVAQRLDDAAVSDSQVSIGGHRLQPSGGAAEPEPERTVLADNVETDAMHFSDLLAGSSFLVASDTAVPATGADAPRHDAGGSAAGGSWAAWGRGFATQLAGTDGEVTLSGQVIGGIAGFDYDWGWMLAGLSAAHSIGSGTFKIPDSTDPSERELAVTSSMTSVHPYLRLAPADGVALWGLAGYGLGSMKLDDREPETGIEMKLAAFGARGALLAPEAGRGFGLDLKSDGFLVLMNTRETAGIPVVEADASRLRLLLDASLGVPLGVAGALRTSLEVGVRYDAGDAEEGAGLELGGGLGYSYPAWGLSLDTSARMLLAHQDRDYREWGAAGSLHLDPGDPGRGISLDLHSSWGPDASAAARLWSVHDAGELIAVARAPSAGRLAAELGYAIQLSGSDGVVVPHLGFALDGSGERTYRVGGSLTRGTALSFGVEGTRTETAHAPPTYLVTLDATLRW